MLTLFANVPWLELRLKGGGGGREDDDAVAETAIGDERRTEKKAIGWLWFPASPSLNFLQFCLQLRLCVFLFLCAGLQHRSQPK